MANWQNILKKETKSLCPKCGKIAVVQRKYKNPGSTMGRRVDSLLEKYSMNCSVEYECGACGHTYR